MALDLTGIENVEFYSGHYLDAVLEGDLKGLFEAWRKAEDEDGRKAPYKGVQPGGDSLGAGSEASGWRARGCRAVEGRSELSRRTHRSARLPV